MLSVLAQEDHPVLQRSRCNRKIELADGLPLIEQPGVLLSEREDTHSVQSTSGNSRQRIARRAHSLRGRSCMMMSNNMVSHVTFVPAILLMPDKIELPFCFTSRLPHICTRPARVRTLNRVDVRSQGALAEPRAKAESLSCGHERTAAFVM